MLSTKDLLHWRLNLQPGTLVAARGIMVMVSTAQRRNLYLSAPKDMIIMISGRPQTPPFESLRGLRIQGLVDETTYWFELAELWPLDYWPSTLNDDTSP